MSRPWPGVGERPPAVAGMFYPADPGELATEVDTLLAEAGLRAARLGIDAVPARPPRAVIAPHAGYVYSGPVAASAYRRLVPVAAAVERVVLLGPAHRVSPAAGGCALSSAARWRSPLGTVALDPDGCRRAANVPGVTVDDAPHVLEHSLEVHLPFLQRTLGATGWTLVPVVVGHRGQEAATGVIEALWDQPGTVVVVSTDLSHYHPYREARLLDEATAGAIAALTTVPPERACGAYPIAGLLGAIRHGGGDLHVELLDLRSSGDTAGPRDQVVGYAAFEVR